MITITKEFTFASAHRLLNHEGSCKNLHGHNYKLIVEITGPLDTGEASSSFGMVMDFKKFKGIVWERILDRLDHHYLNDIFASDAPTAENMVAWIAGILESSFSLHHLKLIRVVLYETDTSYATWYNTKLRSKK